jgi:hypothetical protein
MNSAPGGVAMKMGRRLSRGRGIVTYRLRYAPLLPPVRLGPPCRRPILIATKARLFMGQDTRLLNLLGSLSLRDDRNDRLLEFYQLVFSFHRA